MLTGALRTVAALFALLGLFPLANALTGAGGEGGAGGTAVPWWDLAVREWLLRGSVVVAVCVLAAILLGDRLDRAFAWGRATMLRIPPRAFALAAALLAVGAAAALAWYCFAGRPFTSDEMAHQWHARILLSGRWFAVAEPLREFFNTAPVFDRDGRWFSQYPVGGPAFVAAGMLLGGAWLINPLLLGVAVWNFYRFLAETGEEFTARVATLLFLLSPMVLIMAASQMNHVPVAALSLTALTALARWDASEARGRQRRQAAIIGLSLGLAAMVRPLDAFVLAAAIGVFQLWRAARASGRMGSLATQAAVLAIPLALLLWANYRTTGGALLFGYDALNGPEHRIGFHLDPNGELHTPRRGVVLASGYLQRLSLYLFEWPLPGILFVAAGLALMRKPTRWDALLAAVAVGILLAYGAYWFDGFFAGPRFLFTAVPAFVYFAARAPAALAQAVRFAPVRRAVYLVIPVCLIVAWVGPLGVASARGRVALYRDQRTKLKTDIRAQVAHAGIHNALVFVNEGWRGRLLARLRALGASQFQAERIVNQVDACGLGESLHAADADTLRAPLERLARVIESARARGEARMVPGLQADQRVAIVPGSTPSPACVAEFQSDTAGTMPYPPFLPLHSVGSDGRIRGDVIFVRDLGSRNERLRARFGDRAWYRYRPAASLADTTIAFVPYRPTGE